MFTSPGNNIDFSSFKASPNGVTPQYVPSVTPDIGTIIVLSTENYDTGANPLLIPYVATGLMLWIQNKQATDIKVIGPAVGDAGIIVAAGTTVLVSFDASNKIMALMNNQISPIFNGPVEAGASNVGFVTIGASPDFPTFGGLWAGVANANRTFANASLLVSGIDQHVVTLSAVQSGTQAGFLNFTFNGANANLIIQAEMDTAGVLRLGFFGVGGPLAAKQSITGVLSGVADADAKNVLTSIINALAAYGLVNNNTT